MSFVAIQALRQPAKFSERFGGCWLVWEPGTWQPPSRDLLQTLGATADAKPVRPTQSDALCFHLGAGQGPIRVGRAPENDCVVSDATVSRAHFVLQELGGSWWLQVAQGRQVTLRGQRVVGDVELEPGDSVQVGNVTLTLEDEAGLLRRMR